MHIILKIITFSILTAITVLFIPAASAATSPTRITIDGDLGDAGWRHGRAIDAFKTAKGEKPQAATTGMILTDAHYLYLAFRCDEPLMDKLQITPLARDGAIWTNDCIEIYVAPFAASKDYYHFIVDAVGQQYDAFKHNGRQDANYDLTFIAAAKTHSQGWTVEMAVPLQELGLTTARAALMNFARERKPVLENTAWHGGFAAPDTWQGVPLTLDARRNLDIREWAFDGNIPQYGENMASINLVSRSDAPLKVLFRVYENGKWITKNSKSINTRKGVVMPVSLAYSLLPKNAPQQVGWIIENSGLSVFRSTYRLKLPDNALVATLASPYYYAEDSYAIMDLQSFLSPASMKNAHIRLTVKDPKGNVQQMKSVAPLRTSRQTAIDISSWQHGTGAVFAELIVGKSRMAYQRVTIPKRPGPFSESTFDVP